MINVFPLPFSITGMRSSSGSTKLIADMAVFSLRALEVMDHPGRVMVNRLVPHEGDVFHKIFAMETENSG